MELYIRRQLHLLLAHFHLLGGGQIIGLSIVQSAFVTQKMAKKRKKEPVNVTKLA
jgi:hypothetical protein